MRINLTSDLHLEFYTDHGLSILIRILSALEDKPDTQIIAGDFQLLDNYESMKWAFKILCENFKDVIFVPGNHEYYNYDILKGQEKFSVLEDTFSNLHILDVGKAVTINNQRFIGGTMWFPDLPDNFFYKKRQLNDFRCIENLEPFIYDHNTNFTNWMKDNLVSSDIVITHHLPSYQSISQDYIGSSLNSFYMTDQESLILDKQPKLWLHGHSHDAVDYMIDQTRVTSNPIGYPHQGVMNEDTFWKIIEI